MRIATYNIHRCIGADGRQLPARVAAVIGEIGAVAVGLQEVESSGAGSRQLDELAERCRMEPIPGPTILRADGEFYGNALLTALPVREIRRVDLTVPGREPRGLLQASLDGPGGDLVVLVTHLGLKRWERRKQVRTVIQVLDDTGGVPLALLGDFNETDWPFRRRTGLRAWFGHTPRPRTFPARLPFLCLDRVWVRPRTGLKVLTVHRSANARVASDHLPVVGEIVLGEPAPARGGS